MKGMTGEVALKTLARVEETYTKVIVANDYDVGVYKPNEMDTQSPHLRDEIYIVVSGRGTFHCDDEDRAFGHGDMLFAPRGAEHGFRKFTSDFAPWVVFFGAVGARLAGYENVAGRKLPTLESKEAF